MIKPYMHREIDPDSDVEIYRNVNRKGVTYSIRQYGVVVAHADEVSLVNAEFIVQPAGNRKVKKTGVKNVHAWVRGELVKLNPSGNSELIPVEYNPRLHKSFVKKKTKEKITEAPAVVLNRFGVWVDEGVNL